MAPNTSGGAWWREADRQAMRQRLQRFADMTSADALATFDTREQAWIAANIQLGEAALEAV